MIERLLSEALVDIFKHRAFDDCFLVDIEGGTNRVEVYIDADKGLSLGRCQKISRKLEHLIEDNGWMEERYTIEVSSPGLDRPLKLRRQYKKNVNRNVSVITTDGNNYDGKLIEVGDNDIILQIDNKKQEKIEFDNIISTKVLVSFK